MILAFRLEKGQGANRTESMSRFLLLLLSQVLRARLYGGPDCGRHHMEVEAEDARLFELGMGIPFPTACSS